MEHHDFLTFSFPLFEAFPCRRGAHEVNKRERWKRPADMVNATYKTEDRIAHNKIATGSTKERERDKGNRPQWFDVGVHW